MSSLMVFSAELMVFFSSNQGFAHDLQSLDEGFRVSNSVVLRWHD